MDNSFKKFWLLCFMNLLSWYSLKGHCCWWERLLWLNLKQGQYDWLGFIWPVKLNDLNAVKWHLHEDNKSLKQKGIFFMFITRLSSVNSKFIIVQQWKQRATILKLFIHPDQVDRQINTCINICVWECKCMPANLCQPSWI